ncbi:hypothetical protein OHA21_51770 [Actinoplanes sp. NBC_00393]|uniref:hypothetical protein n=1 Tax=Actinoplanes sp. NBC_00393 TaxID=2975953 RepID=UPI002E1CE101
MASFALILVFPLAALLLALLLALADAELLARLDGSLDGPFDGSPDGSALADSDGSGETVAVTSPDTDGLGSSAAASAAPARPSTVRAPVATTTPVRVLLFISDLPLDLTCSRSPEISYRHAAVTLRPG